MTDRPMLFSGTMVRANLLGLKTNTRRDLTKTFAKYPQLAGYETDGTLKLLEGKSAPHVEFVHSERGLWNPDTNPHGLSGWYVPLKVAVGDRLWVRENAAVRYSSWHHEDGHKHSVTYRADEDQSGRWLGLPTCGTGIRSGEAPSVFPRRSHNVDGSLRWQPSVHMPRWASRLTLIVTGVKVERLQDISREDAIAEGLEWVAPTFGVSGIPSTWNGDPRESYFALWDHINGAGAAAKNPWVAVYAYTVHRGNIDQIARAAA